MSYRVTVEIGCDEVGCAALFKTQRVNKGGLSKTYAAFLAVREGWDITGTDTTHDPRRAFCPNHVRMALK